MTADDKLGEAVASGDASSVNAGHDPTRRGILFVVSSPSGGGKGTLIRRVVGSVPELVYSVSWTTRGPRAGERHGVNYFFATVEEFERMREAGGFLEWAVVHGNLYGTSREFVESEQRVGRDVVLEIDVQGAESVRRAAKESVSVFILPPSYEVLRERLSGRQTETARDFTVRLRNARGEVARYTEFDYLVLNDEVERAAAQLASIVYAERARRERQEALARRVLATFPAEG
ncbi:MAG TPA: guanylate kinase [Pyrinomonadaceae bacterium]|nr:guanylate kinase [Pyrinomonadaceae bacterium]